MNYFNKIKISLQNAHGSPQYFFLFWTGCGEVDISCLKQSFFQVLSTYRSFFEDYSDLLLQKPFEKELPFILFEYKGPVLNAIEAFLEEKSVEMIENYGYTPIILVFFHNPETKEFCILQMNNHIHLDGISGYLFFRDLASNYNTGCKKNYKYSVANTTDNELIRFHLSESNLLQRFKYKFHRFKIALEKKYVRKKNKIKKIYNCNKDSFRKVNYTFIHIDSVKTTKNRNTLILSAIAKHLLDFKGHLIDQTLVLRIPLNIRNTQAFIGNHAAPYHILIENTDFKKIYMHIEKKMKRISSFSKKLAMYALISESIKNTSVEDTFKVFHYFSNQMHCYVTNIQDYFYIDRAQFLLGASLGFTGMFNYPLQANIGAIFSITYHKDSVGISIACSPIIMTKNESKILLENIKSSLVS